MARLCITTAILLALVLAPSGASLAADGDIVGASPAAPGASGAGQDVEVTDAGIAMTFPDDWTVELIDEASDRDILVLASPEELGPEVEVERVLVAEGPHQAQRETFTICSLVLYTPVTVTADEFLHHVFARSPDLVVEQLDDRTSRVLVNVWLQSRILVDYPDTMYVENYAIEADDAVAVLMCTGVAAHRDDWLSIAQSFESMTQS